ncbi:SAM-dependent methyltransferase [Pseudidiomarina aestuarii]|uniref:tRNA 5-carboxymethoxyuridine methyltransferase n=1 Tax=Pseudidiomarina aestuarii TaxID=624146 RepID=A0A7Z7ETD8_9GAMM|nr:methyltransferase domain-containing protein [Pseudidiomarina aestuarii]RUO40971.1 SAM-dependent methyltransferase [Pseudidiomarina aestuarii]
MSEHDQSFASMTGKFQRNIYATTKGRLRLAVLKRDLASFYEASPLRILDIGGGLGQLSAWFIAAGHQVTHTDIAAEMVVEAKALHQQQGLLAHRYEVAALQDLPQLLESEHYDLVLCHAVLEWMANPEQALLVIKRLLAPNGQLSLMFYNRNAKYFANAIYGNFDYVQSNLKVKKTVRLSPQQPLDPNQVEQWIQAQNGHVLSKTGVRVIHDYLRNPKDAEQFDQLLEIELRFNQESPFRDLGRYLHWLIRFDE